MFSAIAFPCALTVPFIVCAARSSSSADTPSPLAFATPSVLVPSLSAVSFVPSTGELFPARSNPSPLSSGTSPFPAPSRSPASPSSIPVSGVNSGSCNPSTTSPAGPVPIPVPASWPSTPSVAWPGTVP
ncbi:hypothetical protein Vretimale_16545, partial [Volvox reticuliferus]